MWILILLAVVTVTVVALRSHRADAPRRAGETRPAEEYAVGHIDTDEYRTRLRVLRGD
ncbi:MAG: hypothetical protein ACRCYU_21800 [Nocardioides sp.]